MANSYVDQAQDAQPGRAYRAWVLGLGVASLLMVGVGLWLAALTAGVALPWAGLALLLGASLALIVGVSKTSSA